MLGLESSYFSLGLAGYSKKSKKVEKCSNIVLCYIQSIMGTAKSGSVCMVLW